VYEVTGASPIRSRLHAAAARGLTRFVGRDPELEQLDRALGRARSGHGQVVAVVGEPGVGKSRLYWEFARSHRTEGWLVLESASVSYGKATAYLPVIQREQFARDLFRMARGSSRSSTLKYIRSRSTRSSAARCRRSCRSSVCPSPTVSGSRSGPPC